MNAFLICSSISVFLSYFAVVLECSSALLRVWLLLCIGMPCAPKDEDKDETNGERVHQGTPKCGQSYLAPGARIVTVELKEKSSGGCVEIPLSIV